MVFKTYEGDPKLNMLDSYSKDNLLPFWFVFMLLSNRMIVFIDRKSKIHPRYLIKFLFFSSSFSQWRGHFEVSYDPSYWSNNTADTCKTLSKCYLGVFFNELNNIALTKQI